MCFQVTCDNCRKKTWKGKQFFYFKIIRQTVEKYGKGDPLELAVAFLGEWAACRYIVQYRKPN